jgi:hypothetical protein
MAGPPPPAPPFGPDDHSVLDPATIAEIQQQATATRTALRGVRDNLLRRRYGNAEPREFTRMDGPWPFLLIRTYPGDVGSRPVQAAGVPPAYSGMRKSPDIIVTPPGPADAPRIIEDRPGLNALKTRELTLLWPGSAYDVWVHVWNLGQNQVSGVRVRVRLDHIVFKDVRAGGFLGGTALDLGDRLSERAHCAVKVATVSPPFLPIEYTTMLIATADCVSDPASGDLSPGADRHSAHHEIRVTSPLAPGPLRPPL